MADYIDKNILCQAYVHVELPDDINPEKLSEIKAHLLQFTESRARFFVYPEVAVDVEFKDGSLKSYLTIAGAIYIAIGNYGGFREGIDYLHTDIKRLADALVNETLFVTRARHHSIKHTEARTGVVGSMKELLADVSTVETVLGQVSVDEISGRLRRINKDAEMLIENLHDDNDIGEIESELGRFSDSIPDSCPFPKGKVPDDAAVISYYEALSDIRRRFGVKAKKSNS